MSNPFDYVNSITYTKENLIKDSIIMEKEYNPYIVNKALSYYPDTIFISNMMNSNNFLDKKLQYEYLLNIVPKKKRFSKWEKKNKENQEKIDIIKKYYNYNNKNAILAMSMLTNEQINIIKQKMSEGGVTNKK